jgi:microcystin degradation protein MlrC
MRILVGALGHESNTFTPFLTTLDDFYVRDGAESLEPSPRRGSYEGILDTLRAQGDVELAPSLAAGALPGGVVERGTYETFKRVLLESVAQALGLGLDGVCLHLHGAMRAEGVDCCEADLLRDLRALVGPDLPISIALDMHANVVLEIPRCVNALVAYHTAPHVDTYETGSTAAQMLLQILRDGVRTEIGFAKLPFLLPGEMAQTSLDPMKTMMERVAEVEALPGVLSASLCKAHCWADVPDIGVAALVVTDGDAELAQVQADGLAAAFWARRAEFDVSAEAYPRAQAVDVALSAPEPTVFLSDSGDNPGAGGTTDVTLLLRTLLERGAPNALYASIWDAAAVQACAAAGVGGELSLEIGGKLDTQTSEPLPVRGTVRALHDGLTYRGAVPVPMGRERAGPIAVLNVCGLGGGKCGVLGGGKCDVILSSTRLSFVDPEQWRRLGLEPLDYRLVALKRGYLTAPLQAISPRSILALTPGPTNCRVAEMAFRRVRRPIYPLDADTAWQPDCGGQPHRP